MDKFNQQEFNLLRKISKKPNANQRELASEMNVSLGKINYVLNNFKNNPDKSGYLYLLTPKGMSEKTKITIQFMKRKMEEYEELKKELNKNK